MFSFLVRTRAADVRYDDDDDDDAYFFFIAPAAAAAVLRSGNAQLSDRGHITDLGCRPTSPAATAAPPVGRNSTSPLWRGKG